jgi:hypothetical protein
MGGWFSSNEPRTAGIAPVTSTTPPKRSDKEVRRASAVERWRAGRAGGRAGNVFSQNNEDSDNSGNVKKLLGYA